MGQVKSPIIQENGKFVDIILTDIQLHVEKARKPASPSRAMEKAIRNGEPGRFYSNNLTMDTDGKPVIPIFENSEIAKFIEKAKSERKIVRIFMPKDGLPITSGQDTKEFIEMHKKKNSKIWQKISSK